MASATSNIPTGTIEMVDMDCYGSSKNCLATRGVGPCVCFIVVFNNEAEVFLEHRSDIFFPAKPSLINIDLCLQNLAEHINEILPTSNISDVLIVGGTDAVRHGKIQQKLNHLREMAGTDAGEDSCRHYKPLISKIKVNDVCWNSDLQIGDETLESMVNIIVHGTNKEKHRVYLLQYASTTRTLNIFLGVLIIDLMNGERLLVVNPSASPGMTPTESQLLTKAIEHFHTHSKALGAIEVDSDRAAHLLEHSLHLASQIGEKFCRNQKELGRDDQIMCEVSGSDGSDMSINSDNNDLD